jgi:hypothetical protein
MTARLSVIALCAVLALGGLGTAFVALGDDGDDDARQQPIELRKDDANAEIAQEEPDPGDGDDTRGDDGSAGGNNTGDGDATWGNDGSGGGDNSYVAPAAPAPAYGGGGDDSGGGSAT